MAGLDPGRAVTIVGARRCSDYGRAVAAELAGSLAAAGLVVVSGMAYRDRHRGAPRGARGRRAHGGGPRMRARPRLSAQRAVRSTGASCATGAVVSESAPGYRPGRWDFPKRNRIMAALAAMTVLVEAREPSGSRITADRALQLGREVGAVPGAGLLAALAPARTR